MVNKAQQEDSMPAPVSEQHSSKDAVKKNIFPWIVIVIFMLLVVAIYWVFDQQQKALTAISESTELSAKKLTQYEKKIQALQQQLASAKASSTEQIDALNSTDIGLSEKIAEIAKIQDLTNDDVKRVWTMAEVGFLLQFANAKVSLASDNKSAAAALALADDKLKALADPRLYRLRALLADEQLALASVADIDQVGIASRLSSILKRIDSLQVLMAASIETSDQNAIKTVELEPNDWKTSANAIWQQIRSLVVIRRQQDGAAAVLVPEQRYFLYQNLKLKIETARLALLQQSPSLYHESLEEAQQWLQDYFTGDEKEAMLAAVKALNEETITNTMPDISGSLVWFKQQDQQ